LSMTEHETSAPSTAEPNIGRLVTFEETKKAFDAYVAAVGKVAYEWNTLHERLGILFVAVTGWERKVALAKWYSFRSDRLQRDMLSTAIDATNPERSKTRPEAPDDLIWLLDRAHELAEGRNNAVHAPCSLYISGSGSEMGAAFFDGNPLARKLEGKDLLVEFAWCESFAKTLSWFAEHLANAIAFPDRFPWPQRRNILPREYFSGESRRS
jgi:hypothetical protein